MKNKREGNNLINGMIIEGDVPKNKFLLSEEEIHSILRYTKKIKHRILIELIYGCGLSLNNVLNLKYSDIDLINGEIKIKEIRILMPLRLINLLRYYFSCEKINDYVIGTKYGKLAKKAAEKIIETISLQSINKAINSDDLRESSLSQHDLLLESKPENCLPIFNFSGRQFS
ncbi:tyrosine-type recombinase/integrase [Candidatus Pacearchaeota archaeon]|nr:tyrosine-type recombinase/integrase [Candidatus Pacearchaeota archaeon]